MFQCTWFEKTQYLKHAIVNADVLRLPDSFIKTNNIESVRTLYWEEHCLECSPPHCYNNCNYWKQRKDNACIRLSYGIRRKKPLKDTLWQVECKFRPWGKLEARINKGGVNVTQLKKLEQWDKQYTAFNKGLSHVSNFVLKNYKFSSRAEGFKRKKYAEIVASGKIENTFLLQCFSKSEQQYNVCLEVTNEKNVVIYRQKYLLKHGFNEYITRLDVPLIEGGLIRLYPENDYQADIIIFACDIVKLKYAQMPKNPAKKVKCVAWDLDCTIWDGILVESEPDSLRLREDVLHTIQTLDERGIIQIIVSKNNERDAIPVLQRVDIEKYFVYKLINWNAKSANISLAANLLNINVDTFAFIDDSVFERKEVESTLPCVRVFDEKNILQLLDRPEFENVITEESKNRRAMYQTEIKRKEISTLCFEDNIAFLKDCEIQIDIRSPKTEEEYTRSFDLIHRTNQLNLSGKKYERVQFNEIINDTARQHYIVECFDKYGSYGQVAFFSLCNTDCVVIDEFAMSCRVANKYVESAIATYLKNVFKKDIVLEGVVTARNTLLIDTFSKIGFTNNSTKEKIVLILDKKQTCLYNNVVKVIAHD